MRTIARRLAADFSSVCALDGFDVRSAVERLTYHRANEHYRNAHRWARMLLKGASFTDRHARLSGTTHAFMVDMNALFENFVAQLLRDAFSGSDVVVRTQENLPGAIRGEGGGSYTEIRPDVTLLRGQRRCSVDAKYKLYADKKTATSDLFQSFAYAQAVERSSDAVPTAFVLYASERDVQQSDREGTVGLHRRDGGLVARVTNVAVNVPGVLGCLAAGEPPTLFAELRGFVGL